MSNRSAALDLSTRRIKIYASAYDATARADLEEHLADTANPHAVDAADVGLGSVDNTSDADKPLSDTATAALALKAPLDSPALSGLPTAPTAALGTVTTQLATAAFVQATITALDIPDVTGDLAAHLADNDNPHAVTQADVGLGAVDNTADLAKPVSAAQQAAINIAAAAAAAAQADIDGHQSNVDNPHSVTKTQIGLDAVANLAPADLPVSSATQIALNLKAPLLSPALSGAPTGPTAPPLTNSTQLATTAYADAGNAAQTGAINAAAAAAAAAQADADAAQADATQALADAAAAQADADAALVAAAEAAEMDIDAVVPSRPGDAVAIYGQTKVGQPDDAVPIDPAWVAISLAGSVVRVTAATAADPQTVAPIAAYPIEPGRIYEMRWRVQRQVNPIDPLNDSVTCAVQWLTNAKAANSSTTIANLPLAVADGVVERIALVGIAPLPGTSLDYTAPLGTIYARPFVDCYGGDAHTTDIITIDVLDVTSAFVPADPPTIVAPVSGATVTMTGLQPLYVANTAVLAALTIKLPLASPSQFARIGFALPVTVLTLQDAAGVAIAGAPTNGYGPGAAVEFMRRDNTTWIYWK